MTAFVWLSIAYAEPGPNGYPTAIPQIHFGANMNISFDFDMEATRKGMTDLQFDQVPFATMRAMNATIKGAQDFLKDSIDDYVDKGATPWTKNGIWRKNATKKQLYAAVYVEKQRPYLLTIAYGGKVMPLKNMNHLIKPVSQRLNKYGNIPRNTLKRKASNTDLYFVGKPKGRNRRPYGLYRRYKRKAPQLVIDLSNIDRDQKAIWPANRLGAAYIKKHFNKTFKKSFNQVMKTARPRIRPKGF